MTRALTAVPAPHRASIASGSRSTPVDQLVAYANNPRRGDIEMIKESLATLGQYKAIVVNTGTMTGRPNEVLAGNHTLAAARALGWPAVDAQFVDVDAATAAKIVLVDNRTADVAGYDDDVLTELLTGLDADLIGTGYTDEQLAELLAGMTVPEFAEDDEQASLDSVLPRECPSCGFAWRVNGAGTVVPVT